MAYNQDNKIDRKRKSQSSSLPHSSSKAKNNKPPNYYSSTVLFTCMLLFILCLFIFVWLALLPSIYCDDNDHSDFDSYWESSSASDHPHSHHHHSSTSDDTSLTSESSSNSHSHSDHSHHSHHRSLCWHKLWSWSTGSSSGSSSSSSSSGSNDTSPDQSDFILAGADTSSVTTSESTISTSELGEDYTSLQSDEHVNPELFEDNYYGRSRKANDPRVPRGHPGTQSWPRTIEQDNLRLDHVGGSGSYMPRYSSATGYACNGQDLDQDELNALRTVSNSLFQQGDSISSMNFHPEDVKNTNGLFVFFGQFVDHVLALSKTGAESFIIEIVNDTYISGSDATINLKRNAYILVDGCRHPINRNSAFMDLSTVYGSNDDTGHNLRTHEHGLMKMTIVEGQEVPPFQSGNTDEAMLGETSRQVMFFTGDPRGTEIPSLTAIHTLFLRNHNRLARKIRDSEGALGWSDEQLYQRARMLNIWTFQRILYREWLPLLLGDNVVELVSGGYESGYDPLVRVESTILFRVGHDMLPQSLHVVQPYNFDDPVNSYLSFAVRNTFFRADMLVQYGADAFLMGMITQEAQKVDGFITDDVRSFLFNGLPTANTLFDLPTITLARSLELGVPNCNTFRNSMGLSSHSDFTPFGSRSGDVSGVYSGDIDTVPLFVCGIFEQHVTDALVGETIHDTLLEQFVRIAIGDPMFYLFSPMTEFERSIVFGEEGTMTGLLKHNTLINSLAPECVEDSDNVFIMDPCS